MLADFFSNTVVFLKAGSHSITELANLDPATFMPNYTANYFHTLKNMGLGKDCSVISIQNITTGTYHLFKPNSNWTNLQEIALPSDWNFQAQTKDILFVVSSSKLYRYNQNNFTLDQIYTLPVKQNYTLYGWGRQGSCLYGDTKCS